MTSHYRFCKDNINFYTITYVGVISNQVLINFAALLASVIASEALY